MNKIFFSFGILLFGLALGYAIQILVNRGVLKLPLQIGRLRLLLQKVALLFCNPVAILGAVWIVNIRNVTLLALPFLGFFALLIGGLLALGSAKLLKLEPRKTGALIPCGSFTNNGAIGALICFVFLGEKGFALVPIYKLFEEISYYGIGFPIAKYYSQGLKEGDRALDRLKSLGSDPFILVAVSSIFLGGVLNFSDVRRPEIYGTINAVIVPLGTILLLTSIGLAMRFRSVRNYLKECFCVAGIKFLAVPVLVSSAAYFLGFAEIDSGTPMKVVIILSSMPVAFNALIPPSIYDLDLDLANSCWFFTTASLVVVLPILLSLINAF